MCFVDYKKAQDCADRERMWIILKGMGEPTHLVVLLRNMQTRKRQSKQSLERRNSSTSGIGGTKGDRLEIMERVKKKCEKPGHYLTVLKTKVMTTGDIVKVVVYGKIVDVVTSFIFLVALITRDGSCDKEIRRIIAMGKAAMGVLTTIWAYRGGSSLPQK